MGASEDKATRADQERQIAAWEVQEIGIEGYGLWSKAAIKELLDEKWADRTATKLFVGRSFTVSKPNPPHDPGL